jgi:solute:Na+ symporter, SSS family
MKPISLPLLDLIIILMYIIGILIVGLIYSRKASHTSEGFFLANRGLKWGVVGAALFASNISTIHLIGLAAGGYSEGLVWGNFEWLATITLILLALVFAPMYFTTKVSTLPEFMEKRYGKDSRTVLAFIGIAGALFVHIGMSLYAGAVVFESFFGIKAIWSIAIISTVTAVYTVIGGLKAVVITESIQTVILFAGTILLTAFALYALKEHGIDSVAELKAALKPGQLNILHSNASISALSPKGSSSGLTWYACLLGYPVLGIWYWCSDQTHVQRVLAAATLRDAQLGPLFTGFLKLLPVFILILPGIIGYAIYRDEIGVNANQTFPFLVNKLLPTGIKGIVSAALLAALMSNIAAALNSIGTLVAFDVAKRFKPNLKDKSLIRVGRISSVVVMILAMGWSTQGGRFASIFEAINRIAAALAPPVSTVLLFGVMSHRGTKQASIVTLSAGFVLGTTAFCLDYPDIAGSMILTEEWGIPFMMQAWWLFCICTLIYWIVSFCTVPPDRQLIKEFVWEKPTAIFKGKVKGWTDPRWIAAVLIFILLIFYWYFH